MYKYESIGNIMKIKSLSKMNTKKERRIKIKHIRERSLRKAENASELKCYNERAALILKFIDKSIQIMEVTTFLNCINLYKSQEHFLFSYTRNTK